MYEAVFSLDQRPFAAAPRTERYYPAEAIQQARESLARTIEHGAGPGLLVGATGTGKTLLLHMLAEQFRDTYRIAMLSSARLCTRKALLQNLLFELSLPYRNMEEGELRLTLIDHLQPSESCPHGMLLLVDEAHTLPLRLLEEIRMITNLVRDGQPRVRLVLAGGAQLEERFAHPKLEVFNQRIAARCYLHSLSRDETFQYVRHQITTVGGDGEEIFSDDALAAIHTATDGIPRLINQLGDHALMLASLGGHHRLDAAGIEEAWADLQQLPVPWQGDESSASSDEGGVIEFGQLDDEPGSEPSSELSGTQEFPSQELDPEAQIEKIERQIAAYSDESKSEDDLEQPFQPTGNKPEIELVFHGPHNPFGGKFEEEEVVIDRYASLEAETMAGRPQVTGPESQQLAAALGVQPQVNPSPQQNVDHESLPEILVEEDIPSVAFNPASDPVMPEYSIDQQPADSDSQPIDDRDMIMIVEPEATAGETSPPATGKAERRQYRQLFSQMRRD